jgi:hypothetical protein
VTQQRRLPAGTPYKPQDSDCEREFEFASPGSETALSLCPSFQPAKAWPSTGKSGQEVKIINTHGKQVLDFFAFNQNNCSR